MACSYESERVNEIMERLGVTAEIIRSRRMNAVLYEFSDGYPSKSGYQSFYSNFCGSVSDGLVSPYDHTSDIDFQWILPINVIGPNKKICDLPYHFVNCGVYIIEDSISHPVFKRLRYISGPMTGFEIKLSNQDLYLSHSFFLNGIYSEVMNDESIPNSLFENDFKSLLKQRKKEVNDFSICVSGPAINVSFTPTNDFSIRMNFNMDAVLAVRCFFWPEVMTEWFIRKRDFNWPTAKTIDRIKNVGCTLVSKGCEGSEQFNIEWRLAFTTAERILIKTFNDTQRKCYVLLKFLQKKYIKCKFPDTISSYHIKTVMLWLCEETPRSDFRRDRIVECFFMCIDRLVAYLLQCHCPLYFHKSVNLFYKLTPDNCHHIVEYLGDVKQNISPKFLRTIDNESMQYRCFYFGIESIYSKVDRECSILKNFKAFIESICNFPAHLIQNACIDTLLKQIEVSGFVFNHEIFTPDWYLSDVKADLMSVAISAKCRFSMSNKKKYQLLKAYSSLLPHCLAVKTCPAMLKRGSICYKFGKYCECLYLTLKVIEQLLDDDVIYFPSHRDILLMQGIKIGMKVMLTFHETTRFCSNVSFSPMERSIVPDLVRQEMEIPKTYDKECWLGWAFIDSIIYAYFLAVMCQHEVSDHTTRDGLILDMEDCYNMKSNDLCYPETALRFLQHCKALSL